MLVDCGTAHSVPHIEKAMAEIGLGWDDLDRIFLTHVHLDHSAGSGMIMQKAKNAKLWTHPKGHRHLIDPTKLIAGTKVVYPEHPLEEIFGEVLPCPEDRLIQTENNQEIDFYGKKFLIHHSPGHAKHHQSLLFLEPKIYFAGDTLGVCYRKWDLDGKIFAFLPSAPNQFEPEVWKNTLKEIQKLNLQKICVTHFGEVSSVSELLSQVEDLVDQFAKEDEKKLDYFEKVKMVYKKIIIHIDGYPKNSIFTYIKSLKYNLAPSLNYLTRIAQGYRDFGLNFCHLKEALCRSGYVGNAIFLEKFFLTISKSLQKPNFRLPSSYNRVNGEIFFYDNQKNSLLNVLNELDKYNPREIVKKIALFPIQKTVIPAWYYEKI